jgi:phage nucleotide-binding protein
MPTNKGPLADQVHPPDALSFLNLLIYGHPGAGKTYLAGTAEDHEMTSPVLVLDVDGGTVTLRKRSGIDVIQVRSPQHMKEIHDSLREDNAGYYKTVVIDSITELQKLDMREVMREMLLKRPDRDPDVPDKREWGISGEHIRRIIRAYRDLEMNTIFTALMVDYKDDKTGQVTFSPSLPGKLRNEIPGFIDIVGYLFVTTNGEEVNRNLQLQQSQKVIAKDRTASLGAMLVNTSIPEMWDLIHDSTNSKEKGTK